MSSLPDPGEVGGVLHFPAALELHPHGPIVLYNRVSGGKQYGPKGVGLKEKTSAAAREVVTRAPGRLRAIYSGVEKGQLSSPRKVLRRAVAYAHSKPGTILVAYDLSRFIRSVSYNRQKNPAAWPTTAEFARLREVTRGVLLATLLDPWMTESERHSHATRRTGKAGRPRRIDGELAKAIFVALEYAARTWDGRIRFARPIREVAAEFEVSVGSIDREMFRPCPFLPGATWRDWLLGQAVERGLTDLGLDRPFRRWWGKRGRPPKWVVRGRR